MLLALFGHRERAAELNALISGLTLIAAAALTARVIRDGSLLVWDETFFVDSFNVFLVALSAFVGFTTALFSRPYMRNEQLAGKLEAEGLPVRLLRAGAYPLRELVKERYLVVVISSQGEGDPPDDAIGFIEFIAGKRVPKLPELKFAVLGLGDAS